jgi:DNA-binding NarL/FixJ family response regulator
VDSGLLERDGQLTALRFAFVSACDGAGRSVVVDGPAGAGKTSLLTAAREEAEATGLLCLTGRGAELEAAFAFGVVHQLLDPILFNHNAALFEGPARFAAPLLGVDVAGAVPPRDEFGARHALFWLVANLAATQPLAIIVDDAHWADAESLAVLAYLANRLTGLRAALVVAARSEETSVTLDALRVGAATHIDVPPLGTAAAATLVRKLDGAADDERCAALFDATGGNPFLLTELARGGALDASPDRVTREIGRRLERLPPAAQALARAAAILGDVPSRQAAALASLDVTAATDAADALAAAGILVDVNPVRFLHPLVRTAVYACIGPALQGAEHGRAARMLADEGASPERVAAQLLRCPPADDPWAFKQLATAAELVGASGAFEAQATYLRRALAEPPPPPERVATLLALAGAEANGVNPSTAIPHLREALAADLSVLDSHAPTMILAGLLAHTTDAPGAVDVLEAHLERLDEHPGLRAATEAALIDVALVSPSTSRRLMARRQELRRRVDAGEVREPELIGAVAIDMVLAGEPAGLTAQRGEIALERYTGGGSAASDWAGAYAVMTMTLCGRYDLALRACDRGMELAIAHGAALDRAGALCFRSELHWHRGDLDKAELDARALLRILESYEWPLGEAFARAVLGQTLLERGAVAEAEVVLRSGQFSVPLATIPEVPIVAHVLVARTRVHLALDRIEDAVADAREAGARQTALQNYNPNHVPWRSVLACALLAAGEIDEARTLVDDELARARRTEVPRGIGMALIASAEVRPERAPAFLEEAVAVLAESGAQLELARARIRLGAALREDGDAHRAREQLRLGIDLAHRCGARRVEEEALAELRASGARPRRPATTGRGALTPSERRITDLAAAGRQNREIAEELFVTTSTVEFHLRNAYRKLGISGRAELSAVS